MAALPVGGRDDVDPDPLPACGGDQASRTETLVVGVRRHDDEPLDPIEEERIRRRPHGVAAPHARGRAGADVREGPMLRVAHHQAHSPSLGSDRTEPPEGRGIALGVVLTDVEAQVAHPSRVLALGGERSGTQRMTGAQEHLLHRVGDDLTGPQGESGRDLG